MDADQFRRMQMVTPNGSAIAEARKQCKLTQQNLADRALLDRRTIDIAEKGTAVTVDTIERIFAGLKEAGFTGPLEDLVLRESTTHRERPDKGAVADIAGVAEPSEELTSATGPREPVQVQAAQKDGVPRKRLWLVAAGSFLAGILFGGLGVYLLRSNPPPSAPGEVRITSPADGAKVGFGVRIEGAVQGDAMVQLLVGNETQSVFYPQPPVTRRSAADTRWEGCAYLGSPNRSGNNTTWYLVAVVPRKEIVRPLSADQLAESAARQSNRIRITRTSFDFESGCGGS